MQIRKHWLRVIFLLSTIVIVTDCCSSRILLLKEETLKIVQHNTFYDDDYDYGDDTDHQIEMPPQEKILQNADLLARVEFIRNLTNDHHKIISGDRNETNAFDAERVPLHIFQEPRGDGETTTSTATITRINTVTTTPTPTEENSLPPSVRTRYDTIETTTPLTVVDDGNSSESTTNPSVQQQNAIDLYYTILRDVLSIECQGQHSTDFCLNKGRCFRYPIGNYSFYSCECAEGFVGERCESKSMNVSALYLPSSATQKKPKILMARMVFSFPVLMAISVIYIMIGAAVVFKRPYKNRAAGMLKTNDAFVE